MTTTPSLSACLDATWSHVTLRVDAIQRYTLDAVARAYRDDPTAIGDALDTLGTCLASPDSDPWDTGASQAAIDAAREDLETAAELRHATVDLTSADAVGLTREMVGAWGKILTRRTSNTGRTAA